MPGAYYRGQCWPDTPSAAYHYAADLGPMPGQFAINCAGVSYVSGVAADGNTATLTLTTVRTFGTCTPVPTYTITASFPECPDPYAEQTLEALKMTPADIAASFVWGFGVVVTLWALAYAVRAAKDAVRAL